MSAEGGKSQHVSDLVANVAVSPDGRMLAGPRNIPGGRPTVIVLPFEGGNPIYTFDAPPEITFIEVAHWTADGQSVLYAGTANEVSNIWRQPLKGGAPTKLTDFRADYIGDFDAGADGRAVLARMSTTQNTLERNAVK